MKADRFTVAAACGEARSAAEFIRARCSTAPRLGVVLGTGLGPLAEKIDHAFALKYADIPGFPHLTAPEHRGDLVCGVLRGCPVMLFRGRPHAYEGFDRRTLTFFPRVLHALGGETLILTNASGGLNLHADTGDVVVMVDHIDWMGRSRGGAGNWRLETGMPPFAFQSTDFQPPASSLHFYDRRLIQLALAAARRHSFYAFPGVYAAMTGPSYETRAEYRLLRRIGADCVGMSTAPEAKMAHTLGLKVLGLSTITNIARPDAPRIATPETTADEVAHDAADAAWKVMAIIEAVAAAEEQPGRHRQVRTTAGRFKALP